MSRVLVTGGSGFIGSHVVDALRSARHEARVYDLRPSPWHDPDEVETVVGDSCDVEALRRALAGCDAVAHLAAAADVDEVRRNPLDAERANARGTIAVLEAARRAGVGRVLYASTIWVYSDVAGEVDEETPLRAPAHLYTATKLSGELYCRSYAALYGLETTVLRFGIPYGPRARPAAVVPALVARALAGEPLTVAGDGAQSRRFVYVEDLADGVVRALRPQAANRTYNLVGAEEVSIREVAETVRRVVADVPIERVPGRSGDFRRAVVDGARARDELGWVAVTPFAEGVRRYAEWLEAPRAAAPPRRRRLTEALPAARRALVPLGVAALVVAATAAAGSVDELTDQTPLAAFTVALGLPVALVSGLDPAGTAKRRAGRLLLGFGLVVLLLLGLPLPETGSLHAHPTATLLIAASGLVSGLLAWAGGVPLPGGRLSED